LAIDIDDPLAAEIDDVAGLEAKMPGQTRDWFYKTPFSARSILDNTSSSSFEDIFTPKQEII
jgi:inorganic pyrophosphatase